MNRHPGTGTGKHHDTLVEQFKAVIEELLAEEA